MTNEASNDLSLPFEPTALCSWFSEGVQAELDAIEKKAGVQVYEVHSGKLLQAKENGHGIYQFVLADGTRVPEEASGRLKTTNDEFAATIISQQGNLLFIDLSGKTLPPGIHWANLHIDDTALLRALVEKLEHAAKNPSSLSNHTTAVFHIHNATIENKELPNIGTLARIEGEQRRAIMKACGSTVSYIWGPPGTGKTRTIAYLIAALIETGERVLLVSHTNTAVNQALYAAIQTDEAEEGPLARHESLKNGLTVRFGTVQPGSKLPDSVLFDKIVEVQGIITQEQILKLEANLKPSIEIIEWGKNVLAEWTMLAHLEQQLSVAQKNTEKSQQRRIEANKVVAENKKRIIQAKQALSRAERAWLWRESKIARARSALQNAELLLAKADENERTAKQYEIETIKIMNDYQASMQRQKDKCANLPSRQKVENEIIIIEARTRPDRDLLRKLQEKLANIGREVINNAKIVFCTLTKNYLSNDLEGQKFDAVIADEISMAMPPLILLAAARASRRVILVGDFLQLPPVVRSDEPLSNHRLGKDVFDLSGISREVKMGIVPEVLSTLRTQRRMHPSIADIARHLLYSTYGDLFDDKTMKERKPDFSPDFITPPSRLLIVDTADLFCWSGKQPGTLSRFNFYTASVSVGLLLVLLRIYRDRISAKTNPLPLLLLLPLSVGY